VSFCQPQILYDPIGAGTRTAAEGRWRIIA
jgi:hypothetical protein